MAKAKTELTVAQKAYIEQHYGRKTAEDMAADTGLTLRKVKAVLKKLEEAGHRPAPEAAGQSQPLAAAGYAVQQGKDADGSPAKVATVSMTPQASKTGDDLRQGKIPARNDQFFKQRVRNGIHVIDPKRPVY